MSGKLIAGNAGPYAIAIADVADIFGRLRGDVPVIKQIGRTVFPLAWLPWLIDNVGMGAVLPHVPADRWLNVYQQRQWVYQRGTGAAHELALGWIGFEATYRDGPAGSQAYDHFDLILNRYPTHAELPAIVGLGRASKSTASVYHRVVYGHDVPAARAAHDRYGVALRGSYSGVEWQAGWPKLSLRATVGGRLAGTADVGAGAGILALLNTRTGPERHIRFAHSRHGIDHARARRIAGVTVMLSTSGNLLDAPWSRLPWSDEPHGTRPESLGDTAEHVPIVISAGTDPSPIRFAHARRALDHMKVSP